MIAALYVETGGVYFGLPDVDPWDVKRDARLYAGPWPVVAHPPCQRWGAFWMGSPSVVARTGARKVRGDDAGCFAAALASVRRFGGVLEHPRGSYAWTHFGLNKPERWGAWVAADFVGGWTCCVDQGWYGHRASKATWLYAAGIDPPSLRWGSKPSRLLWSQPSGRRRRERRYEGVEYLSHRERAATPFAFRDLLLSIARSVPRISEVA